MEDLGDDEADDDYYDDDEQGGEAEDEDEEDRLLEGKKLRSDELQWAKRIKSFLEAEEPEVLECLSDWMIVQIAIVARGDVEEALERAQGYKGFIEEYQTIQSVNFGVQCVQEYLDTYGDMYYLCNAPLQSPVGVSDFAKSTGFASPVRLKGYYYIMQSSFTDLVQIREGASYLVDCKGFNWVKKFGLSEYQRWWIEFGSWYPQITNKVRIFNSPTVANVMFSMGRQWLPERERHCMKFGCSSPLGSLQNIYKQPNEQIAQERILCRVREGLEKRYQMERTFRINENDNDDDDIIDDDDDNDNNNDDRRDDDDDDDDDTTANQN